MFFLQCNCEVILLCYTYNYGHPVKQQQQQLFYSGTTRVSQYQKKLSLTHAYPDHQSSFIIFLLNSNCTSKNGYRVSELVVFIGENSWNDTIISC